MKTSGGNTKVRGRGGGALWGTALKSRLCRATTPSAGAPEEAVVCRGTHARAGTVPEDHGPWRCSVRAQKRGEAVERSCHLCARSPCFVPPVASLTGPNATCSTSRDAGEESGIKLGLGKWEERCSKVCHLVSRYTNQ